MTIYNVHLFREMRFYFSGIEATSHEEAVAAVSGKATIANATALEDCDGSIIGAVVDVRGDKEHRQSRYIPKAHVIETVSGADQKTIQRLWAAAPELLAALEKLLPFAEQELESRNAWGEGEDYEELVAAINHAQVAIAQADGEEITYVRTNVTT